MNSARFDEILKQITADGKMSRNEKKALNAILEESGENELARMRHQVFETARAALKDPRDAEVLHWVEDLTKALSGTKEAAAVGSNVAEACFSPGESCRQQILTLLRRAVKKADICVFTITDNEISDQILRTHQRGVKVRVITDDDKSLDRGSDIERLGKKGVEICFDGTPFHMHHKYAIFDAQTLLTGSYNWTRSAATRNEENILVTDDRRFVGPYQNHFDGLWSKLRGSR